MSLQATRDAQVEEIAAITVELIPNYNLFFVCLSLVKINI